MSHNKFCFLLSMLFLVLTISFVSAITTIDDNQITTSELNITGNADITGDLNMGDGFITSNSPVRLLDGLKIISLNSTGGFTQYFHIFFSDDEKIAEEKHTGLTNATNKSLIFFSHDLGNPYKMGYMFYNANTNRSDFVINQGGANRASLFERSLMIGKGLGNATIDGNYTLCQGFSLIDCDTSSTGADLGVEDDIEAKGSIYSQENINATGNFSLGQKIVFTLGEIIDNIVDGWITITGGLNVTQNLNVVGNATIEGNLSVTGNASADWFKGNLNWSDVQNAPTSDWLSTYNTTYAGFNTTANIIGLINNTAEWTLNFSKIFSDDWTNVTITESQISNLVHTVNETNINVLDVNASSATIHGDLNVTGTSYLGDIIIDADNITTNNIISKDGNVSFWNGTDKNMIITQDGNVGIGTTNPIRTLDVNGVTRISGGGLLVGDVVPGNPANPPEGEVWVMDDDIDVRFILGEGTSSGESAGMKWNSAGNYLSIYHSSVGTGSIVLDSSGNVGIGTVNPTHKLNVVGDGNITGNLNVSGDLFIGGNVTGFYEEGEFEPAFDFVTGDAAVTTIYGAYYTKIGRIVHLQMGLRLVKDTDTGVLTITGLPFTAGGANSSYAPVTLYLYGVGSAGEIPTGFIEIRTTTLNLKMTPQSTGAATDMDDTDIAAESFFQISASYRV